VERWTARLGLEEAARMLAADNEEPMVTVRPNLARATREEILARLRSEDSPRGRRETVGPCGSWEEASCLAIPAFREGLISLQDEAEASVVSILDPREGEWALDLCAAPGGKPPRSPRCSARRAPDRARASRKAAPAPST